jgi:hypothetical protein
MHLVGPYLTTTSYKKRKEKITKSKQEEFERGWRDRNVRLKDMGLPKETFEQYMEFVHGRCKKTAGQKNNRKEVAQATSSSFAKKKSETVRNNIIESSDRSDNKIQDEVCTSDVSVSKLRHWVTGPCSSKPSPIYTGTKVKGIGTMHKSNAVPIFSDDEAKEISSMRR